MKKKKLIREEWRVVSNKFVRFQRLPAGCKFVLKQARGRQARNDKKCTRHFFHLRAADVETVSNLISDYLEEALIVKPSERELTVRLVGPDGEVINGKRQVGKVRKLGPTADEIQEDRLRETQIAPEIDEIAKLADMDIRTLAESRDDPEVTVLRGYVRALVALYGGNAVKEALPRET